MDILTVQFDSFWDTFVSVKPIEVRSRHNSEKTLVWPVRVVADLSHAEILRRTKGGIKGGA